MSDQGKKEISPATSSELESIVASCTCLTKTPEVKYHAESCRYRQIMESRKPGSAATGKDAKTRLEQVRDILAEVWQEGYEAGKSATPSGGGEILCDSHRTAYELAPPKKCVICDLVEGYSELANRPSGGGGEKWTGEFVENLYFYSEAGKEFAAIAYAHNATLK